MDRTGYGRKLRCSDVSENEEMGKNDEDYSAQVERLVETGMLHARISITRPDSKQYSAVSV